jgi:hypothetical protein
MELVGPLLNSQLSIRQHPSPLFAFVFCRFFQGIFFEELENYLLLDSAMFKERRSIVGLKGTVTRWKKRVLSMMW